MLIKQRIPQLFPEINILLWRYDGCAVVEVEDRAFEATLESHKQAVMLSHRYLNQFLA